MTNQLQKTNGPGKDIPPTKKARRYAANNAVLELLVERWPLCFHIYEPRRQPLKVGIAEEILTALADAVTGLELSIALAVYTSSEGYLRACVRKGAVRIGLDGQSVGPLSEADHNYAVLRLAELRQKQMRRRYSGGEYD